MATELEITRLKLLVGAELMTDEQLGQVWDTQGGDIDLAAATVWEIRAGKYHTMVNISESGSSRQMGDMHKNALAMAEWYRKKRADSIEDPGEPEVPVGRTTTRRIVRL